MNQNFASQFRTLLVLGRVSNLPTVWSNCLAGWWLGGGGNFWKLPLLFSGVSFLYVGGMYLNDAFDADFDRERRSERPIPSGKISLQAVWYWGFGWLMLGILCLTILGKTTGALGIVLAVCILIYDATHKAITASPWLMGLCRFWVYVIAGSTGAWSVNGWSIWCGAALAIYIAGLSYVARRESLRGPIPYWPFALLAAPIVLAFLMDTGMAQRPELFLSLLLVLWVAQCVRTLFQPGELNVGRIVSGLLAGIVLVDWLAVADGSRILGGTFLIFFVATLWLQRFVPAT